MGIVEKTLFPKDPFSDPELKVLRDQVPSIALQEACSVYPVWRNPEWAF